MGDMTMETQFDAAALPVQQRPDPLARLDGKFFWDAAQEGRLVAQECTACGGLWHPPRPMCPACHSLERGVATLSGRGRLLSWAQSVHPRPFGFAVAPISILVVLEEGVRMVSTLEGARLADLRADLPVEVTFVANSNGKVFPSFRLAEG